MSETPWKRQKLYWIQRTDPEVLLNMIENLASDSRTCFSSEIVEEVLWISSRGSRGQDHGLIKKYAEEVGGWRDRNDN